MKVTEDSLKELMNNYNSKIQNLETLKVKYQEVYKRFNEITPTLINKLSKLNINLILHETSIVKTGNYDIWNDGDYFHVTLSCFGTEKFKFLKYDRYGKNSQRLIDKSSKIEDNLNEIGFRFQVNHFSLEKKQESDSSTILIEFWIK